MEWLDQRKTKTYWALTESVRRLKKRLINHQGTKGTYSGENTSEGIPHEASPGAGYLPPQTVDFEFYRVPWITSEYPNLFASLTQDSMSQGKASSWPVLDGLPKYQQLKSQGPDCLYSRAVKYRYLVPDLETQARHSQKTRLNQHKLWTS